MNVISIVIFLLLAAAVILAVRHACRHKGSCGGCPDCEGCGKCGDRNCGRRKP